MLIRPLDGAERVLSVNHEPLSTPGKERPDGVRRTHEELEKFAALVSISSDFMAIAGPRDMRPSGPAPGCCERWQGVRPPRRSRPSVSDTWVYLLRCRDGSLYTGWTVDLERRLSRHRAGVASRYTASRLPVELSLAIPMPDRTSARREEARIKRLTRAAKLELISRRAAGGETRCA